MNDWQDLLLAAVDYCKSEQWSVVFDKEDKADLNNGIVYIDARRSLKSQFFLMLHEIGHLLLLKQENYSEMFEKHKGRYGTLPYRISVLEEEIAAWNMGETLAKKNAWTLDNDFYKIKAKMLSTYCLWVNQRKHPHPWFSKRNDNTKRETNATNRAKQRSSVKDNKRQP